MGGDNSNTRVVEADPTSPKQSHVFSEDYFEVNKYSDGNTYHTA